LPTRQPTCVRRRRTDRRFAGCVNCRPVVVLFTTALAVSAMREDREGPHACRCAGLRRIENLGPDMRPRVFEGSADLGPWVWHLGAGSMFADSLAATRTSPLGYSSPCPRRQPSPRSRRRSSTERRRSSTSTSSKNGSDEREHDNRPRTLRRRRATSSIALLRSTPTSPTLSRCCSIAASLRRSVLVVTQTCGSRLSFEMHRDRAVPRWPSTETDADLAHLGDVLPFVRLQGVVSWRS
jgi:hypothetical protein